MASDRLERDLESAALLRTIGDSVSKDLPTVTLEVSIPRYLAERAAEAWRYRDKAPRDEAETDVERRAQEQAATLERIGEAIANRGKVRDGNVVVELDSMVIALAMVAADDGAARSEAMIEPSSESFPSEGALHISWTTQVVDAEQVLSWKLDSTPHLERLKAAALLRDVATQLEITEEEPD